jgi:hypothetical protein
MTSSLWAHLGLIPTLKFPHFKTTIRNILPVAFDALITTSLTKGNKLQNQWNA